MNPVRAAALLIGLLLCAGCFTTAPPKLTEPEPAPLAEPKAPPPVLPEQVNAQNKWEKVKELTEELDFEQNRLALKAPHE